MIGPKIFIVFIDTLGDQLLKKQGTETPMTILDGKSEKVPEAQSRIFDDAEPRMGGGAELISSSSVTDERIQLQGGII